MEAVASVSKNKLLECLAEDSGKKLPADEGTSLICILALSSPTHPETHSHPDLAYRVSVRAPCESRDNLPFQARNDTGILKQQAEGAPPIGFSCSNKPANSNEAGRIMNKQATSTIASGLKNFCPPPPPPKSVCFSAVPQSGAPSYPPTAVTSRAGSVSPTEAIAMSKRLEALEQQVCAVCCMCIQLTTTACPVFPS